MFVSQSVPFVVHFQSSHIMLQVEPASHPNKKSQIFVLLFAVYHTSPIFIYHGQQPARRWESRKAASVPAPTSNSSARDYIHQHLQCHCGCQRICKPGIHSVLGKPRAPSKTLLLFFRCHCYCHPSEKDKDAHLVERSTVQQKQQHQRAVPARR